MRFPIDPITKQFSNVLVDINMEKQGNQLFYLYNMAIFLLVSANKPLFFPVVDNNEKTNFEKTNKLQVDFMDFTSFLVINSIIYLLNILRYPGLLT